MSTDPATENVSDGVACSSEDATNLKKGEQNNIAGKNDGASSAGEEAIKENAEDEEEKVDDKNHGNSEKGIDEAADGSKSNEDTETFKSAVEDEGCKEESGVLDESEAGGRPCLKWSHGQQCGFRIWWEGISPCPLGEGHFVALCTSGKCIYVFCES